MMSWVLPVSLLGFLPGAGEGHGEAVLGATLCGVDWAEDDTLVGCGGPPNRSPRRSVLVVVVVVADGA